MAQMPFPGETMMYLVLVLSRVNTLSINAGQMQNVSLYVMMRTGLSSWGTRRLDGSPMRPLRVEQPPSKRTPATAGSHNACCQPHNGIGQDARICASVIHLAGNGLAPVTLQAVADRDIPRHERLCSALAACCFPTQARWTLSPSISSTNA